MIIAILAIIATSKNLIRLIIKLVIVFRPVLQKGAAEAAAGRGSPPPPVGPACGEWLGRIGVLRIGVDRLGL